MWADEEAPSWSGIWYGLIHCGECHALYKTGACPKCGHEYKSEAITVVVDGVERTVPMAMQGAISWPTHVLLRLMQREWERPLSEQDSFSHTPPEKRPSQKMIIVILFWTLFEHLMDRFFIAAMASLPQGVSDDLLRRYTGIGSRLDRLYRTLFGSTFLDDLTALGHEGVYAHLVKVQQRRNEFVHGQAEAIDGDLVYETVERLHDVQGAWVALYNLRCTGNPKAPRVWEGSEPISNT